MEEARWEKAKGRPPVTCLPCHLLTLSWQDAANLAAEDKQYLNNILTCFHLQ